MTATIEEIIPTSIRENPPPYFILMATEEEVAVTYEENGKYLHMPSLMKGRDEDVMYGDGKWQYLVQRTEEKRAYLKSELVRNHISEDVINALDSMNIRDLFACELLYLSPVADLLLKPSPGEFNRDKLYDGEYVLEFRLKPEVPENLKRNRRAFYKEANRLKQEYHLIDGEQVAEVAYANHLNFSAWQYRKGVYHNLMDPGETKLFKTSGAHIAEALCDDLAPNKAQYFMRTGVEGIALKPLRHTALRRADSGAAAHIELRNFKINVQKPDETGMQAIESLIDRINSSCKAHIRDQRITKNLAVINVPIFAHGNNLAVWYMQRGFSGCMLSDSGNFFPLDTAFIQDSIHGAFMKDSGLDKKFDEMDYLSHANRQEIITEWIPALIINIIQHTKIVQTAGGNPKVIFPIVNFVDSNDIATMQGPKILKLSESSVDSSGQYTLTYNKWLRPTASTRIDMNFVKESIENTLAQLELKGTSQTYAYVTGDRAPLQAYSLSGTIDNPVVEIRMDLIHDEKHKLAVAKALHKYDYRTSMCNIINADGTRIDMPPNFTDDTSIQPVAQASRIVISGNVVNTMIENGEIPYQVIAKFRPDPPHAASAQSHATRQTRRRQQAAGNDALDLN
jgi:hypothetical protein